MPCSPALNLQEPGVYQVCDGAYDDPSSHARGAETDDADDEDGGDEVDAYVCVDVLFMLSSGTASNRTFRCIVLGCVFQPSSAWEGSTRTP